LVNLSASVSATNSRVDDLTTKFDNFFSRYKRCNPSPQDIVDLASDDPGKALGITFPLRTRYQVLNFWRTINNPDVRVKFVSNTIIFWYEMVKTL
jgi:hypothetical protein